MNTTRTLVTLTVFSAAVFGATSTACAQSVAASQAAQRGRLFGLGEGMALAVSMTTKPSRVEPFANDSSSRSDLERRTYIRNGLTVVVVAQRNAQTLLPVSVEISSAEAIRDFSKELSETPKSGVIPSYGQPLSKTEHSFRYLGPAESCDEIVELSYRVEQLSRVKWSFCGE